MAETELFKGKVDYGSQWIYLKRNADQEAKITEESTKKYQEAVKRKEKAIESSLLRIAKLRKNSDKASKKELQKEDTRLRQLYKQKRDAELILASEKRRIQQQVSKAAEIFEQNRYKKLSSREKLQYQKDVSAKLKLDLKAMKDKYAAYEAEQKRLQNIQKSLTATAEEKAAAKTKSQEIETKKTSLSSDIDSMESDLSIVETMIEGLFSHVATRAEKAAKAAEEYSKAEQKRQETAAEAESALSDYYAILRDSSATDKQKREAKDLADQRKAEADAADEAARAALDHKNAMREEAEGYKTLEQEQKEAEKKEEEKKKKQAEQFAAVANKVNNAITSNLQALYGQQGRMQGRLQGSGIDWKDAVSDVSWNVGLSGLVSQKNIVAKMVELVDSGVAYNLEMRAFLAETSQNIASTFSAANGTLLRLIRLQQSDTTAARLGMEAMLTKLFNSYFKDTSYLANDTLDTVASELLDVSATLPKNDSLAFEFIVQKWLGSLYSLGMSEQAVQQIAQGINYLGTGNVSALNGNSALQTLFAMSANRAGGKSYAQMLTTGIDADTTNDLLKSMVEYLAEIADSQSNNVTKSAYAELFGMSLTDLRTFSSLTKDEISSIHKQTTDYDKLTKETQTQLSQIISRLNISQLVDTVIDNAEMGAAETIGGNAFTYGTWKALSLLKDYVGKIEIPGITAAGFGLASGMDLLNLAQTVIAGMGLVGSLIKGIGSMAQGGAMNLNTWNYDEYTQRGGGLSILNVGSTETTSYSAMIGAGGGSAEDIETVTMESGKDKGNEASGTSSEEMEEQKEIPQKIYDALAGDSTPTVLSLLQEIDDRLDPGRVFYTAISGVLSKDTVSQVTNLSAQLATAKATIESANEEGSTSNEQTKSATGVTVSSTQSQIPSNVNSQALSGNGVSPLDGAVVDLSSMITDAVATALNNVLASNSYSGIPVRITNGG